MTKGLKITGVFSNENDEEFDEEVFETEFHEWLESRNMRIMSVTVREEDDVE